MTAVLKEEKKYTYKDYSAWEDGENWEIIKGIAYPKNGYFEKIKMMAPSPNTKHQQIAVALVSEIRSFLKGKTCKVFYELDVVLSEEDILKPDIFVVCDKEKIKIKGCFGTPDFIVEILSPATSKRDKKVKYEIYRKYGVKEYWIVDPIDNVIYVHILKNGEYYTNVYTEEDSKIPVSIFCGELCIDINTIFYL